jgi:hypothetical protein
LSGVRWVAPRSAATACLYGALAVAFCWPIFDQPQGLGSHDWDVHLFFHGAVLKNLIEYGQLPFWNPWNCGGNVLWQNPQVAVLSPVYPLALMMSVPLAVKVNIVLHYWISFVGMHLLLRRVIGLEFLPGVVFLASVFTMAGSQAMHLAVGHNNFLPAFYLPWMLFFFCRALETGQVRDAVLGAAILALMVFNGGLHIVPMAVAGVGVLSLVLAVGRRQPGPIWVLAIVGAASFAFAAPKLLPMMRFIASDQFFDARTVVEHPDAMTIEMMLRSYLDPYQTRGVQYDLQRHGWFEYGNYIGVLASLLIAASLVWIWFERQARDRLFGLAAATATMVLLALSAGEFSAAAPASLATHLPLFSNFRIPSRYTIAAALFGIVAAGWALKTIATDIRLSARMRTFAGLVCALATLDLLATNRGQLRDSFAQAPFTAGFRFLGGGDALIVDRDSNPYRSGSPMFRALMDGKSFFNCYEVMRLTPAANADQPLVFSDGKSKVFTTTFSPNRVEAGVAVGTEPSRVFLNQNFADGWRSAAGPVERDPVSGKPTVLVQPGYADTVAFTFRPPGLGLGLLLAGLAIAVSAAVRRVRLSASAHSTDG